MCVCVCVCVYVCVCVGGGRGEGGEGVVWYISRGGMVLTSKAPRGTCQMTREDQLVMATDLTVPVQRAAPLQAAPLRFFVRVSVLFVCSGEKQTRVLRQLIRNCSKRRGRWRGPLRLQLLYNLATVYDIFRQHRPTNRSNFSNAERFILKRKGREEKHPRGHAQ